MMTISTILRLFKKVFDYKQKKKMLKKAAKFERRANPVKGDRLKEKEKFKETAVGRLVESEGNIKGDLFYDKLPNDPFTHAKAAVRSNRQNKRLGEAVEDIMTSRELTGGKKMSPTPGVSNVDVRTNIKKSRVKHEKAAKLAKRLALLAIRSRRSNIERIK
jgi:hypothetical protein